MEQRLTMITLGVNDLGMMRAFYSDVFGWKEVDFKSDNIIFYNLNGIQLALYRRASLEADTGLVLQGDAHRTTVIAHNLRSREDVDTLFADLEERGAEIIKDPEDVYWGGYSGYISDPEGNLWEFAHNPFMKLDETGNVVTE